MTYALFLLLMLLSAIWGASILFIKIGVSEMGPLTFAVWRVFNGPVVLITVIRLRREKLATDLRTWSRFAVTGVFNALDATALFQSAAGLARPGHLGDGPGPYHLLPPDPGIGSHRGFAGDLLIRA